MRVSLTANISPDRLEMIQTDGFRAIFGIFEKYKVLPKLAERALSPGSGL